MKGQCPGCRLAGKHLQGLLSVLPRRWRSPLALGKARGQAARHEGDIEVTELSVWSARRLCDEVDKAEQGRGDLASSFGLPPKRA